MLGSSCRLLLVSPAPTHARAKQASKHPRQPPPRSRGTPFALMHTLLAQALPLLEQHLLPRAADSLRVEAECHLGAAVEHVVAAAVRLAAVHRAEEQMVAQLLAREEAGAALQRLREELQALQGDGPGLDEAALGELLVVAYQTVGGHDEEAPLPPLGERFAELQEPAATKLKGLAAQQQERLRTRTEPRRQLLLERMLMRMRMLLLLVGTLAQAPLEYP